MAPIARRCLEIHQIRVLELFLLTLRTLTPVLAITGHVRPSAERDFPRLDAQ
ncbi:Hypothetical protein PMT_2539 [Prochlorococcus marinus str. MIT 9313]|uniref:Uncharacterized protein n=1 Tax=Prochlorococcus marinus (strain MIT 9313) TaxID=74547 RepID=B9ERV9_PROMM|nr:hypothetical protein [Prochlorococcus marinus]CAX32058.1 Hypothetical protein PMT_2539 [Prochlorococcus marinus str. MIT 9313]